MVKALKKPGVAETLLNRMKPTNDKPMANTVQNGERWAIFSTFWEETGWPLSSLLLGVVLEVLGGL